jgi:hypothetical protein
MIPSGRQCWPWKESELWLESDSAWWQDSLVGSSFPEEPTVVYDLRLFFSLARQGMVMVVCLLWLRWPMSWLCWIDQVKIFG